MRRFLFALASLIVCLFALACSATRNDSGGGPAHDSGGVPGADGTTVLPDGAVVSADGDLLGPDGSIVGADGSLVYPDTTPGPDAPTGFDAPGLDTAIGYTLVIAPVDGTVILAGGAPATVDYFAQYAGSDGTSVDVTSTATWTIDDATMGSFAGSKLTVTKAGKTTIRASAKGLTASTSLTVSPPVVIVTPGAPADSSTKFGGPVDATRKPSFVYPSNDTLVPPNMNVLEFHFLPGSGNTLFELAFLGPAVDVKVYLKCDVVGSGCAYSPDATVWKYLSDGARGKGPVTYTLRGSDGTVGGKVGVSGSQTISFGQENIVGGLYYWNAGAGATMRYEFGVTGKTAEVYMNAAKAGAATCVGCHVLSRDGTRISLGLDIPAPSPYKVFDVASKTLIYAQGTAFGGGSNFFSFSPDSSQIMTSNGISIVLRKASDGTAITDPLVAKGAMPDWSPDGVKMVFANPATTPPCIGFCGATGVDSASIDLLASTAGTWGKTAKTIVPFAGQNNFYPAFSPDNGWVIFNRSPSNANSFDAKDAQVWVVAADGGTPIKLTTASTGGDSWPKWVPEVQAYKGGSLMWLTFSSRRAYGLRMAAGTQAQLWMVAFDPAKAKAGVDPTGPAFWLPFQDLGSGNHIAQWVTKVARQPCTGPTSCESGETCVSGTCKPIIK
jgi:hypothetical protein